jgi:hypothetical protein
MGYDKYNHWFGRIVRWWMNTGGDWAITIGQTAYYSCGEDEVSPWWHAHEDRHKWQWRRDGHIHYACKYLWYLWKVGYSNNPYEVDANQAADRATAAQRQDQVQD